MSIKRQATTEINHDNWDEEDPSEHEEMGTFQAAPKEVLEKRVIRTAKRRVQTSGDEPKKSVFSGFGGFNKTQPSSFDFLANLTNGNKTTNGSSENTQSTPTTGLFSNKPASGGGLFGLTTSSSPNTKTTFGMPTSQTSTLFGGTGTNTNSSPFGSSATGESPFKIPTSLNSTPAKASESSKPLTANTQASSVFGTPTTNTSSSLFGSKPSTSTPLKTSNLSSSKSNDSDKKEESSDEKKLNYYTKLKGLNESVSDWIKKHVEETPLCILSPIFKDYEKYLKEIQEEYHGIGGEDAKKTAMDAKTNVSDKTAIDAKTSVSDKTAIDAKTSVSDKTAIDAKTSVSDKTAIDAKTSVNHKTATDTKTDASIAAKSLKETTTNSGSSIFNMSNSKPAMFGSTTTSGTANEKPSFSFGVSGSNTSSNNTNTTTTSAGGFSFGVNSNASTTSSPFSFSTNTTTSSSGATPFSFGNGKPFSFNSNIQSKPEETKIENNEEDEPPKVEFTPVVEENSVFDKKCKIFVKKDGTFVDNGVGTLYVKKVEDSNKHQLLVRANTNLGNILLNLILSSSIPTQRLGKNNVMLVCIPTPDAKPPPTSILIRVKTAEEADELLEALNKFKG